MVEKMIETVIVAAVESIPELAEKVLPLMAPENTELPFVVYISQGATEEDSLSGWLGSYDEEMEINVLHRSYKEMKLLAAKVVEKLQKISEVSLTISENSPEGYEHQIQAYRKVIHIKIMF